MRIREHSHKPIFGRSMNEKTPMSVRRVRRRPAAFDATNVI
jgi:hypothetical protein